MKKGILMGIIIILATSLSIGQIYAQNETKITKEGLILKIEKLRGEIKNIKERIDNYEKMFPQQGIGISYNPQNIIVGILFDSPAREQGLQIGDEIMAVGGEILTPGDEIKKLIHERKKKFEDTEYIDLIVRRETFYGARDIEFTVPIRTLYAEPYFAEKVAKIKNQIDEAEVKINKLEQTLNSEGELSETELLIISTDLNWQDLELTAISLELTISFAEMFIRK